MTDTSSWPPQERAAHQFMDHKGLGNLRPTRQEKVEGRPCWYFLYEADGNRLELEVSWKETGEGEGRWETVVTGFSPRRRRR